jgi:hypothetical protein
MKKTTRRRKKRMKGPIKKKNTTKKILLPMTLLPCLSLTLIMKIKKKTITCWGRRINPET